MRTTIAITAMTVVFAGTVVSTAARACDPADPESRSAIADTVRDEYNAVRTADKARRAELEASAQALVDAGTWTSEDKNAFFSDPEIKALNEPRTAALQAYLKQMYVVTNPAGKADDGFCESAAEASNQIKAMDEAGQARDAAMAKRLEAVSGQ